MTDGPVSANTVRGEVKGKIGDREFVLVPSFENIQNVENTLGRSLVKLVHEFRAEKPQFSFTEVASLIFIAQREPKMTFKKIGDLLTQKGAMWQGMALLTKFVATALDVEEETDEQGNPDAGTGK